MHHSKYNISLFLNVLSYANYYSSIYCNSLIKLLDTNNDLSWLVWTATTGNNGPSEAKPTKSKCTDIHNTLRASKKISSRRPLGYVKDITKKLKIKIFLKKQTNLQLPLWQVYNEWKILEKSTKISWWQLKLQWILYSKSKGKEGIASIWKIPLGVRASLFPSLSQYLRNVQRWKEKHKNTKTERRKSI